MMSNRAIYDDGWMAATTPFRPWQSFGGDTKYPSRDFKRELYNIANDDLIISFQSDFAKYRKGVFVSSQDATHLDSNRCKKENGR